MEARPVVDIDQRPQLLFLAIAASVLGAACSGGTQPGGPVSGGDKLAAGAERSHPIAIPLETYRTRRSVRLRVGSQSGTFLLDTAGGLSILTPDFARRIGCKPWGRIVGFHMMGDRIESPRCDDVRFEVAGLTLKAPVVGVIDLMASLPKDAAPLDGLLALDVFADRQVTLDVTGHALTVETEESMAARTRDMQEGRARIAREVMGAALSVFVAAPTPQGSVWLELDSGNGGTILVSQPIASLLGLDPSVSRPQRARFDLIGGTTVEGDVLARDMVIDGNLGMPFLSSWRVSLDLRHFRVWFQPVERRD